MKPFLWGAGAGLAAFLCAVVPVLPGPRWMEGPADFLMSMEAFFVFPWIGAILFTPVAAAHAVFNRDEHAWWRRQLTIALLVIVLVPAGILGGVPIRRARFAAAAERAAPLIASIEEHRRKTGEDPLSIDSPGTGMMAYPTFECLRADAARKDSFRRYELVIHCSSGLLNWDRFVYWPEGGYPDHMYGGGVERVGAWAYVHE